MTTGIPVYLPLLDNAVELPWRYKSHRNVFPILFFHSAGDMPEPSPVQQFPHLYALSYSGLSVPIYIIYYPKVKKANHCYPRVRDRPSTSITVSLCYFAPTQMSNCSGPVFFNSSAELGMHRRAGTKSRPAPGIKSCTLFCCRFLYRGEHGLHPHSGCHVHSELSLQGDS